MKFKTMQKKKGFQERGGPSAVSRLQERKEVEVDQFEREFGRFVKETNRWVEEERVRSGSCQQETTLL